MISLKEDPDLVKQLTIEILCEDEAGNEFYWAMYKKPNCTAFRTHDHEHYCYPHSRWYRPYKRYFNLLRTKLEELYVQLMRNRS